MFAKKSKYCLNLFLLLKCSVSNQAYRISELKLKEYGKLDANMFQLDTRLVNNSDINLKKDDQ